MAASDKALNRNRGALNPLPLGRKAMVSRESRLARQSVPQNGHRLKNDRLVAENSELFQNDRQPRQWEGATREACR